MDCHMLFVTQGNARVVRPVGEMICKFLVFIASQDDVYLGFSNTFTSYEIANTTYILREATIGVYVLQQTTMYRCTG